MSFTKGRNIRLRFMICQRRRTRSVFIRSMCSDASGRILWGVSIVWSPYQLQAVAGNKYVSVVFPSGSAAAKSKADAVIRYYLPMDGKDNPAFPEQLEGLSPYSGKAKFFRGPIGISGVSTSLMHYLEGVAYTGVWFVADQTFEELSCLVCVKEKGEIDKLKEKVPASDIIRSGNDFIYLTGKEQEAEEDTHGGFGF